MRGTKTTSWIIALVFIAFGLSMPASSSLAQPTEQAIKITVKQFEYSPNAITVKKGVPVILEFTSLDRLHGFFCPALKIRSDIPPGKITTLRFTPDTSGTFQFHCDNFCGQEHEKMTGTITVTE